MLQEIDHKTAKNGAAVKVTSTASDPNIKLIFTSCYIQWIIAATPKYETVTIYEQQYNFFDL
jgi:hypothetical protein